MKVLHFLIVTLATLTVLSLPEEADSQIVYDNFTDSYQMGYIWDVDEEADRVSLASIEHPITRIRIKMYSLGFFETTFHLKIYDVDPVTGYPGNLLASSSAPVVGLYPILDLPFDNLQLESTEIWVGFLCTPTFSQIGPKVGFGPTIGRSESFLAYYHGGAWHTYGTGLNTNMNLAMQIIMTPDK